MRKKRGFITFNSIKDYPDLRENTIEKDKIGTFNSIKDYLYPDGYVVNLTKVTFNSIKDYRCVRTQTAELW